ncbi:site-specific DNA-methyltransferase [Edaphobacter sp. HDX4]|uniref:site-specific DNA-methyltransferase n=1 Tax=Edaphobacter sp. HDX4 TaxID=2794064 RepID=UPI002FE6BFDA
MTKKQKLELTWIGKEKRPKLEPRILLEDPAQSYHAAHRVTDKDIFDNRLIFGDNLLALKALEQEFTGQIKCVYIDPPFNTGEMFEHYDDGMEHSIWLSNMRDRLEILKVLLSDEGSIFIHIDDNELGYLIALADEVFFRKNRIAVITFKQSSTSGPKAVNPGLVSTASYILYYAKDKTAWRPNRVYQSTERDDRYNRYIVNSEEDFASWRTIPLREAFSKKTGVPVKDLNKTFGEELEEELTKFVLSDPSRVVRTARVAPKDVNENAREALSSSRRSPDRVFCSHREGRDDYFFLNGEQLIFYSTKAKQIDGEWVTALPASTIWDDLLSNNLHAEGGVAFPNGKKPEALLQRILSLATSPDDLVLDSFAGSGTTGAVAHKMNRRWIMIELRDHCNTHLLPRLKKVIGGEDQSGITKAVTWKGGGGFRYFCIAPSLLTQDKWGNWVISKEYKADMLAEAVCKLEGFTYAPSDTTYWQQGYSTERDFLYVTTAHLTPEQLQQLSDEVGPERTLLVLCTAFRGKADRFGNLTIKKIPKQVLSRCEWGRDDYSLQVENLPQAPPELGQQALFAEEVGE